MKTEIRVIQTTDQDLIEQIRDMIRDEFLEMKKKEKTKAEGSELLSRKETAEALHIAVATLDNYTTQGLIEASRIGSRILYSRENIEKALKKLEGRKWRRS